MGAHPRIEKRPQRLPVRVGLGREKSSRGLSQNISPSQAAALRKSGRKEKQEIEIIDTSAKRHLDSDQVLAESEIVCTEDEVAAAFDRMAAEIRAVLKDSNPVVLCVMLGGLIPTARLLGRFDFPLELDYVHATRYRGDTRGRELHWRAKPATALAGREVLVIDDILDEGITLAGVLDFCRAQSATTVRCAVLVNKQHGRKKALERADFTGLEVDDRYVFGCGMDYRDRFRNLRSIYAVRKS